MPDEKVVLEEQGQCPYCGKQVKVRKFRRVLSPAQKAEIEERVEIVKDEQTTL